MAVNAIDLIIGSHNAIHTGIAAGLHGRKMDLPKFLFSDPRRTGIDSSGGLSLTAEMLGNTADSFRLHAGHRRCRHLRRKIRVFGITFLTSAPSRITQHIQRRHQCQFHMAGSQLPAAGFIAFFQSLRIEGRPGCQVDRKQAAAQSLMAMRTLTAHHHRNVQAGMLQHIFLKGIVGFFRKCRCDPGLLILICPGIRPVETI